MFNIASQDEAAGKAGADWPQAALVTDRRRLNHAPGRLGAWLSPAGNDAAGGRRVAPHGPPAAACAGPGAGTGGKDSGHTQLPAPKWLRGGSSGDGSAEKKRYLTWRLSCVNKGFEANKKGPSAWKTAFGEGGCLPGGLGTAFTGSGR